jgi:hypothetical protein
LGAQRVVVVAALALVATQAPALELELIPAWEGNYRPGAATEVVVRVSSPVGGILTVSAHEPLIASSAESAIEPNAAVELPFAIRPAATQITIEARLGHGEPVAKTLQLVPLERPMLGVAVDGEVDVGAWLGAAQRYVPVPVGVRALPRTAAGYAAVAGIVLGPQTFAALDPQQQRALLAHAGRCGRVILPDGAEHAARELAAHSACGDRFIERASVAADAALGVSASALPADPELRALGTSTPPFWRLAAWFFAGYAAWLVALAVAAGAGRARWPTLLATPVLASLLMAAAWAKNPPERRVVLWAEQEAGAAVARFRLLYDVHGRGGGRIAVPVAPELGPLDNLSEAPVTLAQAGEDRTLLLEPHVLSRHTVAFGGSFASAPELLIGRDTDGVFVRRRDRSSVEGADPPTAWLALDGRIFAVPPLSAGETWRPTPDQTPLSRSAVPAPLARAGDALLQPLTAERLPVRVPPHDVAAAWLLLRASEPLE